MGATTRFDSDPNEALSLARWAVRAPERHPELRTFRFEYSSRGDRVPGRLLLPPTGDGRVPAVLLQHGTGGSKDAAYLDATGGPWAQRGMAVASIDFPLHGDRASAKLSQRLLETLRNPGEMDPGTHSLLHEFVDQAVVDLRRAVSVLESFPEIDAERIGYGGFSLGAMVGAIFCGLDPRPRAAAFALGGGGGPAAIDPAGSVGGFAPRPALFVNATRDEVVSRGSAEALFAAAGEPKELLWFESSHSDLPGAALKAMWLFLQRHLSAA